jgi:hypothetical protein
MPDCPSCKIVWRDGKRYVERADGGEFVHFDQFVTTTLQAILHDMDEIKKRLNDMSGLCP